MTKIFDIARGLVRQMIAPIAVAVNKYSHGKITPTIVTLTGLAMHLPIAYLIAQKHFVLAALGLVVFGLFDTLDGALARLQKRASNSGMLLDATTDRMKEVILYIGIAQAFINSSHPSYASWAVAACGGSLLVSYVKAKGETAVKAVDLTPNEINRLFQDGLARFEIRMSVLVIGLLFNHLYWAVAVVAVMSWATAISRLVSISNKLTFGRK